MFVRKPIVTSSRLQPVLIPTSRHLKKKLAGYFGDTGLTQANLLSIVAHTQLRNSIGGGPPRSATWKGGGSLSGTPQEALHDDRNAGPVLARQSWEGKFYLCQDASAPYSPWWPHLSQRWREGQEGYQYFPPKPLHGSPIRILSRLESSKQQAFLPSSSPGDSCLCKADSCGTSFPARLCYQRQQENRLCDGRFEPSLLLTPSTVPSSVQTLWCVKAQPPVGEGALINCRLLPAFSQPEGAAPTSLPSGSLPHPQPFFFFLFLKPLLLPSFSLQLRQRDIVKLLYRILKAGPLRAFQAPYKPVILWLVFFGFRLVTQNESNSINFQ